MCHNISEEEYFEKHSLCEIIDDVVLGLLGMEDLSGTNIIPILSDLIGKAACREGGQQIEALQRNINAEGWLGTSTEVNSDFVRNRIGHYYNVLDDIAEANRGIVQWNIYNECVCCLQNISDTYELYDEVQMFWESLQKATQVDRDIYEVNDTLECFKNRLSEMTHKGSSVLIAVDMTLSEIGLFAHIMFYLSQSDKASDWLHLKLFSSVFSAPQSGRSYIPFSEYLAAFRDQELRCSMLQAIRESNNQKERTEQIVAHQDIGDADNMTVLTARRRRRGNPSGR